MKWDDFNWKARSVVPLALQGEVDLWWRSTLTEWEGDRRVMVAPAFHQLTTTDESCLSSTPDKFVLPILGRQPLTISPLNISSSCFDKLHPTAYQSSSESSCHPFGHLCTISFTTHSLNLPKFSSPTPNNAVVFC